MAQTNSKAESLLPQRALGALHQLREFGNGGAGLGMRLEQLHVVFGVLFALALRLFCHVMFSGPSRDISMPCTTMSP